MAVYLNTSPAIDWFWIESEPLILHRVAVWATREDGTITGLIPVTLKGEMRKQGQTPADLVPPPPVEGRYKHISMLNFVEAQTLTKEQQREK